MCLGPFHAVQLLNPINHELVKPLLVGGLRLDKNVRHIPASIRASYILQPGHGREDVTDLSRFCVDQDIGSLMLTLQVLTCLH